MRGRSVKQGIPVAREDPITSVEAKTRFTPPYAAVGPIINPKFSLLVNIMLP